MTSATLVVYSRYYNVRDRIKETPLKQDLVCITNYVTYNLKIIFLKELKEMSECQSDVNC